MINSTAGHEPQFSRDFHRLWSLWDIMFELQIGQFVSAYNRVATTAQAMLLMNNNLQFTERVCREFIEDACVLRAIAEDADLPVIMALAEALLAELRILGADKNVSIKVEGENFVRLSGALSRLQEGAIAELKYRVALMLPPKSRRLWDHPEPLFGIEFSQKFPRAQYDLDEAGKCLALGRSTAAVFHLMRVVEVALAAVHGCLGIQVQLIGNDRNWGNILGRVRVRFENQG